MVVTNPWNLGRAPKVRVLAHPRPQATLSPTGLNITTIRFGGKGQKVGWTQELLLTQLPSQPR